GGAPRRRHRLDAPGSRPRPVPPHVGGPTRAPPPRPPPGRGRPHPRHAGTLPRRRAAGADRARHARGRPRRLSPPRVRRGQRLGCETDEHGYLRTDRGLETTVPGVFAAGDITGHPHLAISAAARGVLAALAIHRSLLPPEWAL